MFVINLYFTSTTWKQYLTFAMHKQISLLKLNSTFPIHLSEKHFITVVCKQRNRPCIPVEFWPLQKPVKFKAKNWKRLAINAYFRIYILVNVANRNERQTLTLKTNVIRTNYWFMVSKLLFLSLYYNHLRLITTDNHGGLSLTFTWTHGRKKSATRAFWMAFFLWE